MFHQLSINLLLSAHGDLTQVTKSPENPGRFNIKIETYNTTLYQLTKTTGNSTYGSTHADVENGGHLKNILNYLYILICEQAEHAIGESGLCFSVLSAYSSSEPSTIILMALTLSGHSCAQIPQPLQ